MKHIAASSLFAAVAAAQSGYINYTTVTGYFLQDLASTNTSGFDYTAVNFGLINQTYTGVSSTGTQWQQFKELVESLNADSALDTVYKVFFLGRHGEGFHNAAESYYGTPAWNCYWSILNGNGTSTWADADLTTNGINQALIANAFWKSEIKNQKIPYPQSYYTSPLTRCLRTANLTFSDIPTPDYYPFVPRVREFFREGISEHTCDRRSSKTSIHNRFPIYTFEDSFTENDELWNANLAETSNAQDARSKLVLDSVFSSDDHTWISVTSHSGEIASILRVLGHRTFSLSTGAVIPVLVKAQFLKTAPAVSSLGPSRTFSAYCTNGPPITSTASGCVCSGTGLIGSTVTASTGSVKTNSASSASAKASSKGLSTSPQSAGSTSSKVTGSVRASSRTSSATGTSSKKACKSKSKSSGSTGSKSISTLKASSKPSISTGLKSGTTLSGSSRATASLKSSAPASRSQSGSVSKSSSQPSACKSKSKSSASSRSASRSASRSSASSKASVCKSKSKSRASSTGLKSVNTSSASTKAAGSTGLKSVSILSASSKAAGSTGTKSVTAVSASSKATGSTAKVTSSTSKGRACKSKSKSASTHSPSLTSSTHITSAPAQSAKASSSKSKKRTCKSRSSKSLTTYE